MKNGRADQKRMQNSFEIEDSLRSVLEIDRLFELSLDICEQSLSSPGGENEELAIAILTYQEDGLRISASRSFPEADSNKVIHLNEDGILSKVWHDGKASLLLDPSEDKQLMDLNVVQNSHSIYCVSLAFDLDAYGLLLFSHTNPDYFNDDRIQIIGTIGHQLSLMLRNAKLFESLEKKQKLFTRLEERSRSQLTQQMHEGLAQSSASIAMRIHLIRRKLAKADLGEKDELAILEELARKMTKEIRYLLFTLKPEILDSGGFVAAIRDLAQQSEDLVQIRVNLDIESDALRNMELKRQSLLFYCVVEAIDNARNRSKAKNIWIKLKKADEESVLLQIEDDGIDLDSSGENNISKLGGQYGFQTTQDRVHILNGRLTINGNRSGRNAISIWIPTGVQSDKFIGSGHAF